MWVTDIVRAMRSDNGEVKRDGWVWKYDNVFIEYECYSRRWKKYVKSGIATTKAQYWVIVLNTHEAALLVSVDALKRLVKEHWHRKAEHPHGGNPTKGIKVPIRAIIALAKPLEATP